MQEFRIIARIVLLAAAVVMGWFVWSLVARGAGLMDPANGRGTAYDLSTEEP